MLGTGLTIILQLACLLLIKGCMSATSHNQNGCYNANVILNCSKYSENQPSNSIVWRVEDKTKSKWTQIAAIKNGDRNISSSNTTLDGRLTIHSNGSLEITSLKPDDETRYSCIVKQGGRNLHVVKLSVACGKVSKIEREVCAEDDVVLECVAKQRTNPRKLKQVKWYQKLNTSDTTWSRSLLVSSHGLNITTIGDGIKLLNNGSLLLLGGRNKSVFTYHCDVTKNVSSRLDRHIIVVKNVKCRSEKRKTAATIKTTIGRVVMTTPIVVAMETTGPLVSRAANYISIPIPQFIYLLFYVIFNWLVRI